MSSPPSAAASRDGALERSPLLLHRREGDTLLRAIATAYPSPAAALHHYVELLVPPALRLCTAHGVALELHLQNTLVVHRRGRLCGFIARDLGGVRLHRGRLLAAGHHPALAAGSFVLTEDLGELQTKLAHALLHAHLGTVFGWAADHLGADEAALWGHTRAVLAAALDAWAVAEPRLAAACIADRAALLAPAVRAKALLRMRIDERVSDYAYTDVASPFGP
nr:IucA/IucC family C-terminal-domain containing protein [Nannocystis sp.]